MADKLTILNEENPQNKWPVKGDVFYFKLSNGKFGYGMVSLGKMDFGPFKNALVIYIYNYLTESLCESLVLKKEDLLFPPLITDGSCWKKGYFLTFKSESNENLDVFPDHYFENKVRGEIYNERGEEVTEIPEGVPIGVESLRFYNGVVKAIEKQLN